MKNKCSDLFQHSLQPGHSERKGQNTAPFCLRQLVPLTSKTVGW